MSSKPHIIAAANRKRRKPAEYDGPTFEYKLRVTIKARTKGEADYRIDTLCAELITGAKIDATDLWVREISIHE